MRIHLPSSTAIRLVSLTIAVVLVQPCGCATRKSVRSTADASALANQHGLHLTSVVRRLQVHLPTDFDADLPNWGLKQAACLSSGFDLCPFAGKQVLVTRYN